MYYAITILLILLTTAGFASASPRAITFFSDGAIVEVDAVASKGIAEIAMPAGTMENTLRIRPQSGTTIQRVDLKSARIDAKREKEIESLLEQKLRLEDRLKALDTREEIFRAAAKSQSAKAPRKSKSNPDPIKSIRQGTEYAIAQLESVYTARRKTNQEIRKLDSRLAAMRQQGTASETVAHVSVLPKNGRIRASYALAGVKWTPLYDIRLNSNGNAGLTMSGKLPDSFRGYTLKAAAGNLAKSASLKPLSAVAGTTVKLSDYRLPASEEHFGEGLSGNFSCILTNSSTGYLPPGEATVFFKGEYRGKVRFEGMSSGRSRKVFSTP